MKPARTIWDEKERQFILKFVDLFVSYIVVVGIFSLAVGVASFSPQAKIKIGALGITTNEKLFTIGRYVAMLVPCMLYILWRSQWRLNLKAAFAVVIIWSIALFAAMYWPIAILPLITLMLVYCAYWSWHDKPTR